MNKNIPTNRTYERMDILHTKLLRNERITSDEFEKIYKDIMNEIEKQRLRRKLFFREIKKNLFRFRPSEQKSSTCPRCTRCQTCRR